MKRTLQIGFTLGVSLFFVWLSLRGVNQEQMWTAIREADLRWLTAYVVVLLAVHVLRVLRWRILLEPLVKVTFKELNPLGAVGFLLLMILPLRLGEFGRPVLATKYLKVPMTASLASILVERIVDGLLVGLMLISLLWLTGSPGSGDVRFYGALATLGFGGGLVCLVLAFRYHARAVLVIRATLGRVSPRYAERLISMLDAFIDGLRVLPSWQKTLEFFGLTVVYWAIAGYGLAVIGWAFGIHLTVAQAFVVIGLQVIGVMIPAAPGAVGTFQSFTGMGLAFAFAAQGIAMDEKVRATAAAYSNTLWFLQMAQQILLGLYYIGRGHIRINDLVAGLWQGNKPGEASSENDTEIPRKPPQDEVNGGDEAGVESNSAVPRRKQPPAA